MAQPSADVAAVLSALEVFSTATDKAAITQANNWLQDFQHSPEAWSTANILLLSPDVPPAARLFAAQTFRAKVTFDLGQVPHSQLVPLRDTLLAALRQCIQGPRTVITQLCLAMSGLALQLKEWENPLGDILDMLGGGNGDGVPILLEFLTVFPEELCQNSRIPMSDDEYRERMPKILTAHAGKVLNLAVMYLESPGVTTAIQIQIFNCVRSWIYSGELVASALGDSPLLVYAFAALASDELFDAAVNLICDVIHETQEIGENMSVIQLIVPRVIALRAMLATHKDDSDRMRGYTRIFAEAGETYRLLLLQAPDQFLPIVEAIAECTAYHDLDVVPITFNFWYRLAQSIGKLSVVPPVLREAYSALVEIIIRHLHFPSDPSAMTSQEAEEFRSFRHVMGDTLKDCCHVLGTDKCLARAYEMILSAINAGGANVQWQAIEAPLFSMRSMGAELDPTDNQILPNIMDVIPSLPVHPRVQYAALLVISRYTQWTNEHPTYIPFQLQYISTGFNDADPEVPAAAGLAMKYLCKDCKQHLVGYMPQLHAFLNNVGDKLLQDDICQICEAVAYVISSMSLQESAQWLQTISSDILSKVHAVVSKPDPATKDELQRVCNWLEQLETMLHVIKGFDEDLPEACRTTSQELWGLFETIIVKYGDNHNIGDRVTRVLRYGLDIFGSALLPILRQILSRLAVTFEVSGISGYLWIVGKIISRFGQSEILQESFRESFDVVSRKAWSMIQLQPPSDIPDVIEDYVRSAGLVLDFAPDVLFLSPSFNSSFTAAMIGLGMINSDIIYASLEFVRTILSHDCLKSIQDNPAKFSVYAQAIRSTVPKHGLDLLGYMLTGLVGEYEDDTMPLVITIVRAMAELWPTEVSSWLPSVVGQFPSYIPGDIKQQFLSDFNKALNLHDLDKVKNVLLDLSRVAMRIKTRRTNKF